MDNVTQTDVTCVNHVMGRWHFFMRNGPEYCYQRWCESCGDSEFQWRDKAGNVITKGELF